MIILGGPIPQKLAKTFDGPPTLERSGSEHRRAVTSPLREEEGLGEKVELSSQERRRDRKTPSLMVKKDGLILENMLCHSKLKKYERNSISRW